MTPLWLGLPTAMVWSAQKETYHVLPRGKHQELGVRCRPGIRDTLKHLILPFLLVSGQKLTPHWVRVTLQPDIEPSHCVHWH